MTINKFGLSHSFIRNYRFHMCLRPENITIKLSFAKLTMPPSALYDDPALYKAYEDLSLGDQVHVLHPEWPVMKAMVGDVQGLNVLDLGCGFGSFCKWASEKGAARVQGVDNSEKMLKKAQEIHGGPRITYECADLDQIALPEESFDVTFSSLTFHYIEHLGTLVKQIHRTLRPGGRLVFSVQHPIWTAPDGATWQETSDGEMFWPLRTYAEEGPRISKWIANGVKIHHKPINTFFSILRDHEFQIIDVAEWMMQPGSIPSGHQDYGKEAHRPFWFIISAKKK